MNNFGKLTACLMTFCLMGCAASGQGDGSGNPVMTNQKILRENEARLNNLENSISALNTQIAQLNNRVYEVRTKTGQRTSMTVVPITPGSTSQPAPAQAQAQSAASQTPAGRRIDPSTRPSPLVATQTQKPQSPKPAVPPPAKAKPTNPAPANVGGPSGQLSASSTQGELAMPPEENTSVPIPVPTGNTYSGNTISAHAQNQITQTDENIVPVPMIPASDLSLPPENPALNLPPQNNEAVPVPAEPVQAPAPVTPARTVAATAQRGEEAAYQTALKAARSGNISEGLRLFRDFLQKYPQGKYTANADYWIGECLYAQGKYQDALSQFQNINSSYPKHHKNADALLKAGMSLTKIGDNAGAQQKYRQLLADFPNSDAAKRVRAMGIR